MTPLGNALNVAREGCYRRVIDNSATRLDPSLHSEIYNLYTTTKVSQRQHANIYEASKSRIKQIILAQRAEEIEPVYVRKMSRSCQTYGRKARQYERSESRDL